MSSVGEGIERRWSHRWSILSIQLTKFYPTPFRLMLADRRSACRCLLGPASGRVLRKKSKRRIWAKYQGRTPSLNKCSSGQTVSCSVLPQAVLALPVRVRAGLGAVPSTWL